MAEPSQPPDPFALQPAQPRSPQHPSLQPSPPQPQPLPQPQPRPKPPPGSPRQMSAQPVPMPLPRRVIQHSPGFRNIIHIGVFFSIGLPLIFFGKFLFYMQWMTADTFSYCVEGLLFAGAFFNGVILRHIPVLAKLIMRPDEGYYNGVWIYPGALAVCFLIFPLYAAFGAWAVLAFGDAAAAYAGRTIPKYKLPWNKKKSFAGLLAFAVCAVFGAYISLYLMPCPLFLTVSQTPELGFVWTLAVLASVAGAIVESLDTKIDDNVRVPLAAAITLLLTAYFLQYSTGR